MEDPMKDGKPWLPDDISFEPGRVIPVPPGVNPSRVAEMLEAIRKERDERVQEAVGQALLNIKTEQGGEVDSDGLSPQTPSVEGDRIETAGTYRARRFSPFSPVNPCEVDPNGLSPHTPGAKLDQGKNRLGLVLMDFASALIEVGKVGTYGAKKYTDHGWVSVLEAEQRYTDALFRHLLAEGNGEMKDPDTQLLHAAHAAWNALARLRFILERQQSIAPNAEATCPRQ